MKAKPFVGKERTILCIPGAEKPFFVYDRKRLRSLGDGFATMEEAKRHLTFLNNGGKKASE